MDNFVYKFSFIDSPTLFFAMIWKISIQAGAELGQAQPKLGQELRQARAKMFMLGRNQTNYPFVVSILYQSKSLKIMMFRNGKKMQVEVSSISVSKIFQKSKLLNVRVKTLFKKEMFQTLRLQVQVFQLAHQFQIRSIKELMF